MTRRDFVSMLALASAAGWLDDLAPLQNLAPPPAGRLVRTMPLGRFDGAPVPPLGRVLGAGLDARQFSDLSRLAPDSLVTLTDQFFVRTAASNAVAGSSPWTVGVSGRVRRPIDLSLDDLTPLVQSMGTHLLECSGNSDPANFGLMSAARWSGVPIAALLDRAGPQPNASLVRVSGQDDDSRSWQTSVAGASWIFSRDDLNRAGAFLATRMNDAPLTQDHGFPVRLVVPNWYGCVAIKWVTRIELVGDDEPATSQMREFAARTHQEGAPSVARDFQPAVVDLAGMPIRVEQWEDEGRVSYRVVGIRWGGTAPTRDLTIRFRYTQPFVRVDDCPAPPSTTTWSLWSHVWRPDLPGRYQIVLGTTDRAVRTRRLDLFYYTREVEIDRV